MIHFYFINNVFNYGANKKHDMKSWRLMFFIRADQTHLNSTVSVQRMQYVLNVHGILGFTKECI